MVKAGFASLLGTYEACLCNFLTQIPLSAKNLTCISHSQVSRNN